MAFNLRVDIAKCALKIIAHFVVVVSDKHCIAKCALKITLKIIAHFVDLNCIPDLNCLPFDFTSIVMAFKFRSEFIHFKL